MSITRVRDPAIRLLERDRVVGRVIALPTSNHHNFFMTSSHLSGIIEVGSRLDRLSRSQKLAADLVIQREQIVIY